MADDVTITVHVRDLTGPGFNSVSRNLNQLQRQAQQMGGSLRVVGGQLDNVATAASNAGQSMGGGMGLRGQAIAAAAALGTTLLPTIGALAPMLTGLAVVGGGAALAMDDLKKKAKELKKPFEEWQKVANKAVAPHTEKAVKSLKGAMKDLTPVIETGADTFGRIAEKAAQFADSPAFKSSLAKNAEMGARWVEEFAGSIGTFTQAFLDFGTKSQPALDAWDNLLGGFLDTGLPSMFKELEQGISGSSSLLNGLASFLNEGLLPALGKIAGSFTEAFGPLLGEMLTTAGDLLRGFASIFEGLMEVVEPAGRILADAWHATVDVLKIGGEVAGSFARNVGGALLESLLAVAGVDTSGMTGGFTKMSDWVNENSGTLRAIFFSIASGITDMVTTGLQMLPLLYGAFQKTTEGILLGIDVLVSGLASAFGDLPIVGDKFKEWNRNFDEFAEGARGGLAKVGSGIESFVDEALPRLSRAKLKLSVDEAEQNLNRIKGQLKDPALTKERKAKLTADKTEAEARLAAAKRQLADFDRRKATAKVGANLFGFLGGIALANRTNPKGKSVPIGANARGFWGAVGGISGRVLGTSYINVVARQVPGIGIAAQGLGKADGGIVNFYAEGGVRDESHIAQIAPAGSWRVWGEPETGGEAYIPLSPAKRGRSREVAEETVGILGGNVEWFAKGGMSQAQKSAFKDMVQSFGVSHFGSIAGYQTDSFSKKLGAPADLNSLVSALNEVAGQIRTIFSGRKESSLLKVLDSAGRKLIAWEKQLTAVNKSLEKARDKLDSLRDASAQLASSVKGGILSAANITKGASGDGPVSVASVMGGLTQSRDQASALAAALADLQKMGLSSTLIQQIAEAGIEGGGLETAGALLGASSSEIQSLNDLQGQINKSATAAGKATADAVYAAQIKAQANLVHKLDAQQNRLIKAMNDLSNQLEKLLARALAGKAAGGIVGAAASGGIRSNLTWVGERGPELLDLPAGSRVWSNPDSRRKAQAPWASMLNAPRGRSAAGRRATSAPAGGGDGSPIVIQVRIGDREFGELWVDAGRKAVRSRGSIEATLRPPRGR